MQVLGNVCEFLVWAAVCRWWGVASEDKHWGWKALRLHLPSHGEEVGQGTGLQTLDALQAQNVLTMGNLGQAYEAWWWIVCVNLAGPWGGAQILRETLFLGVSMRVFLDELSICISEPRGPASPVWVGLSLSPVTDSKSREAWVERKDSLRPSLLTILVVSPWLSWSWDISLLSSGSDWSLIGSPGSEAFRLGWQLYHGSSGVFYSASTSCKAILYNKSLHVYTYIHTCSHPQHPQGIGSVTCTDTRICRSSSPIVSFCIHSPTSADSTNRDYIVRAS